jgi:hypothetical protein
MLLSATGITIEIATGIGIMIATEIAGTTITTEFIGIGMETAMTAGSIATATEDITAGTGETTGAMTAVMGATTGVGTDVAGFTGTAATGFTKN